MIKIKLEEIIKKLLVKIDDMLDTKLSKPENSVNERPKTS